MTVVSWILLNPVLSAYTTVLLNFNTRNFDKMRFELLLIQKDKKLNVIDLFVTAYCLIVNLGLLP